MNIALVAIGANLPFAERQLSSTLDHAITEVSSLAGVEVCRQSKRYCTPAWPPGSGPEFVNAAISLTTDMPPTALLAALHGIEAALGRERPARWAPRVCDLDLLAYQDLVLPDKATVRAWMAMNEASARTHAPTQLILPHPRLHERAFVLVPLCDIAPDWRHPLCGLTARQLCQNLTQAARDEIVAID